MLGNFLLIIEQMVVALWDEWKNLWDAWKNSVFDTEDPKTEQASIHWLGLK